MAEPTLSKKRYVLLSEASRISGYTREYIDRLCRIGKMPCRVMGDKTVVELDTLLSQTGTILLGSEHISFIELQGDTPYPIQADAPSSQPQIEDTPSISRLAHIAVIGQTHHEGEELSPEKKDHFPSNALPFFSSALGAKKTGFHIPVSGGANIATSRNIPVVPPEAQHMAPERSTVKRIMVMPKTLPENFVPAAPSIAQSQVQVPIVSAESHPVEPSPHSIETYESKLPMVPEITSFPAKIALAVLALGLFVAPTALGIGSFLNDTLTVFGSSLRSGARTTMAAVGLIDPNRETEKFPHLLETSQLLSASGAAGTSATQQGIVITPASTSTARNAAIKDAIQQTFSSPVQVIPDSAEGKTGIIKPVFQKNNPSGFIYVLVPFRN